MAILELLTALIVGASVSVGISFTAGPATQSNSSFSASPNTVVADGVAASTLNFYSRDMSSNPVPNTQITLSASGTDTTFAASTGTTDANGLFKTTVRSTKAQSETISARFNAGRF